MDGGLGVQDLFVLAWVAVQGDASAVILLPVASVPLQQAPCEIQLHLQTVSVVE